MKGIISTQLLGKQILINTNNVDSTNMIEHFFHAAAVYISNGMLIVDSTETRPEDRHYHVKVVDFGNRIEVFGEKVRFNFNFNMAQIENDIDLFAEKSIEEISKWPWPWNKKKIKILKNGIVEYKKRVEKLYISNSFTIITK